MSAFLNKNCVRYSFRITRRLLGSQANKDSADRQTDRQADQKKDRQVVLTTRKNVERELMNAEIKKHKELLETTTLTMTEPDSYTAINAIPEQHLKTRRVRISKPSKNAMQSGTNDTHLWRLDFENRERWENPLIGWTSTGDPLSNLNVWFSTAEDAASYCEKNGWYYEIDEPMPRKNLNKSYAENFSWNKRTRVGTK